MSQILTILYSFSRSETVTQAHELAGCSLRHASQWYIFIQEVIEEYVLGMPNSLVGGLGVIVQIDETKFGKRKNNCGHHVEGNWVFGGCEYRFNESTGYWYAGKTFAVVVQQRDRETLFPIIARWILPGSTVWSDSWGAYRKGGGGNWDRLDISHECVNHKKEFVTFNGIHTNAIESQWFHFKRNIPNRIYFDAEKLQLCLYANMFLRNFHYDRWAALIRALAIIRFDSQEGQLYIPPLPTGE